MAMLLARSIQGVCSACIGVSGMCLAAETFQDENARSKIMGILLGGGALGVLVGYPFGGFLYEFVGKSAPFLVISFMAFMTLSKYIQKYHGQYITLLNIHLFSVMQLAFLDFRPSSEVFF